MPEDLTDQQGLSLLTPCTVDALSRYLVRLPDRVQAMTASAIEAGALPEAAAPPVRQTVLEIVRPALRRTSPRRTRSLWRAMCVSAEHCIVDVSLDHPGKHWDLPRPVLRVLYSAVTSHCDGWRWLDRAYRDADTPSQRIAILLHASAVVSAFLRSGPPTLHAPESATASCKTVGGNSDYRRAVALFTRALDAYPETFHTLAAVLGVSTALIDAVPVVPRASRHIPLGTETHKLHLYRHFEGARAPAEAALVLSQIAALLSRPAAILELASDYVRRTHPERIDRTRLGGALDWLVSRTERRCAEITLLADAICRPGLDQLTHTELARTLSIQINSEKAHYVQIAQVIRLKSSSRYAGRLEACRRRMADTLASATLPAVLGMLRRGWLDGLAGGCSGLSAPSDEDRMLEVAMAALFADISEAAELGGHRIAVQGARRELDDLLQRAGRQFRPAAFETAVPDQSALMALASYACLCARLRATTPLTILRARLPPGWATAEPLHACATGPQACCNLLRCALGLSSP